jgi:hypothetical protein
MHVVTVAWSYFFVKREAGVVIAQFMCHLCSEAVSREKHCMCMEPYAGVDYNLTLCQLQNMYHGRPYARVDLNPMPHCNKNAI